MVAVVHQTGQKEAAELEGASTILAGSLLKTGESSNSLQKGLHWVFSQTSDCNDLRNPNSQKTFCQMYTPRYHTFEAKLGKLNMHAVAKLKFKADEVGQLYI